MKGAEVHRMALKSDISRRRRKICYTKTNDFCCHLYEFTGGGGEFLSGLETVLGSWESDYPPQLQRFL